jgi:hypothetical protein
MPFMPCYGRRSAEHKLVLSSAPRVYTGIFVYSVKGARNPAIELHARHNNINTLAIVCASEHGSQEKLVLAQSPSQRTGVSPRREPS